MDALFVAGGTDSSMGRDPRRPPSGGSITVGGLVPGDWDVRGISVGTYTYYSDAAHIPVAAGETIELDADDTSYSGTIRS